MNNFFIKLESDLHEVGKLEKLESFKLERLELEILELESFTEVGKSQAKLEITEQSWKEPIGVGKFELKLENSG